MSLNAEVEVKAGTKMRIDFRSGANYYRETGWGGQLLWRVQNTPILEAKLQGTFSNEAAIEMKNAIKVGGLAGPELTLKPYIKSEATVSTEKPCQVDAALTMGVEGELKAIVQAWSYTIGEWGSQFPVLGPWELAKKTFSANATPTLVLTGPYNLENQLVLKWPDQMINDFKPHVVTSTGTDSFELSMDDSKGLRNGISKVEVAIDGNPAFFTANYDQLTLNPSPAAATQTMKLPLILDDQLKEVDSLNENGWYTPFRLEPGPHELQFKVFDRCGDHSIATCAIWVKAETNPWLVKNANSITTWEVGIEGFKSGDFPVRKRTVAPTAGALNIAPNKNGTIKRYNDDGLLIFEGTFTNDIRTGIWKRHISRSQQINLHQVEFDSSGDPLSWKFEDTVNYDRSLFFRIEASETGPAKIQMAMADNSYIDQGLEITDFDDGLRTIGKPENGGEYHTEIFQNGLRNGIATHSDSVNTTFSGTYGNSLKQGTWILKDPDYPFTTELNYTDDVLNGSFECVLSDKTISGSYADGQKSGAWSSNGPNENVSVDYLADKPHGLLTNNYLSPFGTGMWHYSGNYLNGVPQNTPWKIFNSANEQVATLTYEQTPLDPIALNWTFYPRTTQNYFDSAQIIWSYLFSY